MQHLTLQDHELNPFLKLMSARGLSFEYIPQLLKVQLYDPSNEKVAVLRHSIDLRFNKSQQFEQRDFFNHVLLGVRAGLAGLLCFENGELVDHKVFRAYMVRKKQGKSQLKYLKTKGKSRAGSRVRLEETKLFFEHIAERLQTYDERMTIDQVFLGCATTLIPFLFDNNPFLQEAKLTKKIHKIPFHIQQPSFENMMGAERQLRFNQVLIKKNQFIEIQDIMNYLKTSDDFFFTNDDW
jgi:hypothetical protein